MQVPSPDVTDMVNVLSVSATLACPKLLRSVCRAKYNSCQRVVSFLQ